MIKKLALLGAARPRYEDKIIDVFNNPNCEQQCWTGWSYKINPIKLKVLDTQFKKDGYFRLYYHDIKNPEDNKFGTGTGFVEYMLIVRDYRYTEELVKSPNSECTSSIDRNKPHRLYALIIDDKPKKIERKKYYDFIDFDTDNPVSKHFTLNRRNAEFRYIIDENI